MSNSDQKLAIGIDVGGTTIKGVLADTRGTVITSSEAVATPQTGADDVVSAVVRLARTLREASVDAPVGVCVPGIIDEEHGIGIFSANLGWKDAPLSEKLSDALGSFVPLGHDVRSGALAEALWGVRRPSCLYVAVGTGIASGVVINSRLAPAPPWAGEIGQVPVPHPDRPYEVVPVEQVASASGIARRAIEAGIVPEGSGAREVEELALSSSENARKAREILETSMSLLGGILATVCHQVGSLPVVLGGGLCKGGSLVYDPLRKGLESGCTVMPAPALFSAALGSSSQALGAAALAFQSHGIEVES